MEATAAMPEQDTASEIEALRRQRDLYAALSETNQLVTVQQPDPATLYRELCRIVVDYGGLALAWIGEPDADGWVRPVAAYGAASSYIHHVAISTSADRPEGRGPTGTAYREDRYVIAPNIQADPAMSPWHAAASEAGLRSSAAFPLHRAGVTVSTLNVYAWDPHFFIDELVRLLRELTLDVSFALDNFDRKAEHQRLLEIVEASPDVIGMADLNGEILYHNPAAIAFLGRERARLPIAEHHPPDTARRIIDVGLPAAREHGTWRGETEFLNRSGQPVPFDQTIVAHRDYDGTLTHYSTIARNISERRKAEQEIRRLAYEDAVTGLPNRLALQERLSEAIKLARDQGTNGALVHMDLDDFKAVNDSLGHPAGDELLGALVPRLEDAIGRGHTLSRIGADEFGILLVDLPADVHNAAKQAQQVAYQILKALEEPVAFGAHWIYVSTCIGVTLFSETDWGRDTILQQADAALNDAKEEGRGSIRFHQASILDRVRRRLSVEQEIRLGLEEQRFFPVFQPLIHLNSGELAGFEALARLTGSDGQLLSPGEFIPVADRTGLILPLGEQILRRALLEFRQWIDQYPDTPFRLSVNVSPRQFQQPDFVDRVRAHLHETGVTGYRIQLELTEGLLLQRIEPALEKLAALYEMGISLAIDDFGTGYSSLSYLQRLPMDALKIDASFVQGLYKDASAEVLIETILAMTEHLGLSTVAEGIETEAQRTYLVKRGCNVGQGFLFAKPMPAEEAGDYLRTELA